MKTTIRFEANHLNGQFNSESFEIDVDFESEELIRKHPIVIERLSTFHFNVEKIMGDINLMEIQVLTET